MEKPALTHKAVKELLMVRGVVVYVRLPPM